jgi:hypothetical protein
MTGTNRPKLGKYAPPGPLRRGPVIVLVQPQLGENIGAAARAMLNCGITELRLVNPRDGWPNPAAYVLASKADPVLDAVSVFSSTAGGCGRRPASRLCHHGAAARHDERGRHAARSRRPHARRGC